MKTFLAVIGAVTIVYWIFALGAIAEMKYGNSQHNSLSSY